jgi:hypothetical protein
MIELRIFENPEMQFNVVEYQSEELSIEEGDDYILDVEESDDDEVLDWAEDNGYLEDSDYLLDNGEPDLDQLRELKYDSDVESYNDYPPPYATPSGRAFSWFEDLKFPLPEGVKLVDGEHPGSDWRGVVVRNEEVLRALQNILADHGLHVNFNLQK